MIFIDSMFMSGFGYIEVFYNRERSHSANNNLSPVEFEERQKLLQKEIAA